MADPNFTTMRSYELIDHCGADGMQWAKAFCQIKKKMQWSLDDIDEELMWGWFANAIETACRVRGLK